MDEIHVVAPVIVHRCDAEPGTCPVDQLNEKQWVPTWSAGGLGTERQRAFVVVVLIEDNDEKEKLDGRQVMSALAKVTAGVVCDALGQSPPREERDHGPHLN